jgi:hypothetical protein
MKRYTPGTKAPASGIYQASHGPFHRLDHQVTIAEGVTFPKCHKCGYGVTFTLLQPVKQAQHAYAPFGEIFEPVGMPKRSKSRLELVVA